jgi:hypothetical protein
VNPEDLIVQLASQASPVTPLASPGRRVVRWLAVAVLAVAAGVVAFGLRRNLADAWLSPAFIGDATFGIVLMGIGAWASLALAIPGAREQSLLRALTLIVLAGWATLVTANAVHAGQPLGDAHWPVCALRVVLVGVGPAVLLLSMIRRAAPLHAGPTTALALSAAAAAGALAVGLVCPLSAPAHTLLGHVGPVVVLTIVGALAGRSLLRHTGDV